MDGVDAFLKRQAQLEEAQQHVKQSEFIARIAEFEQKGTSKVQAASKLRQIQAAASEMHILDTELLATRRARLKQFYHDQLTKYQQELTAKGLSLPYN